MIVVIDQQSFVTCKTCREPYPEFFEQIPDNRFSEIVAKYRLNKDKEAGITPPELDMCVADASVLCPARIISVEQGCGDFR
jgi:ferredoxin